VIYEHRTHRLRTWPEFIRRAARHLLWGLGIVLAAVGIGTVGYHVAGGLGWLDAFLNASMILTGMGPVDRMETPVAKLFAAFYALFSGLMFVAVTGIVLTPWIHRLLHWVHLDEQGMK
jgi:hypothetical protein